MNARQIFAAISIAMAGNLAMAVEAEQFEPQSAGTAAQAAVAAPQFLLLSGGEATQFVVDRPVAPLQDRDQVRAEARQGLAFSELYVG